MSGSTPKRPRTAMADLAAEVGLPTGTEGILSEYSSATKHEHLARIEGQLWALVDGPTRKKLVRELWLSVNLRKAGAPNETTSQFQIRQRAYLLSAPRSLWDEVDGEEQMSLNAAVSLYSKIRRAAGSTRSVDDAAIEVIAHYKKLPLFRTEGDRTYRRPTGGGRMEKAARRKISSEKPTTKRGLWTRLREILAAIAEESLPEGADELTRKDLFSWLDGEVTLTIKQFTAIAKAGQKKTAEVTRQAVIGACRVLHMDPPSPGGRVNMAQLKQKKRKLAQLYHPDSNGGDASMTSLYDEVIKSAAILESYDMQQSRSERGGEVT